MTDAAPPAEIPPATDAPATRYVPAEVEAKWIATWHERGAFAAEVDESKEPYTIVVPPPNVTGALHMGHALNGSVQDCLVRWKRMQGYNALWVPGVDHAGIATQAVVEKDLRREGTTRQELGRERFLARVQEWKDEYERTIHGQFRRLGSSMDFRRARFTMDEHYHRAVLEAFVRLHAAGHVYRDNYLVNWDAGTMSAISDLEVRQVEVEDEMVQVAYPVLDAPLGAPTGEELVVATVRPETIVADVAVAVHPEDARYRHLLGRHVRVPLTDRSVPVIADEYVDSEFGTGALKVTPGHDQNDFDIGLRHDLPQMSAIHPDRTMATLAGRFAGMDVDEARRVMADELEAQGLLRAREPYRHNVPHSDRSGVRIEPLISLQWFADMRELAKPAVAWVERGEVRFVPDGAKSIFHGWMDDLKPWCLSRQLWWGHQLPVWYCTADESHVHVSVDGPGSSPCPECGNGEWRRDDDVLDTWFSSGMWDHATLGWPDDTPELRHFHPTAVLCTARDIINLWVARMMMFSWQHLREVPFRDVYIHSTIQAADGRRMSKSLGTGVDPLELIDRYGADATRYGLLDMSSTQDVRFNEGRIRDGRDLANKLWNATRLLVMLGDPDAFEHEGFDPTSVTAPEDRWILHRLDRVLREVTRALDGYEFALATKAMYAFCWHELCDWYIESVKDRLRSDDPDVRAAATTMLAFVLDRTVRMLHPVMPHLTEELAAQVWGERGLDGRLVARTMWHDHAIPEAQLHEFTDAGRDFERLQTLVTRLRALRQAAELKPQVTMSARLQVNAEEGARWLQLRTLLKSLANVDADAAAREPSIALPIEGGVLHLHGLDPAVLRPRLEAELQQARSELRRAEGKLANDRFTARAPQEVVDEERAKVDRYRGDAAQLESVLAQL